MQNTMQEFHWQEFCHQDTVNQRTHYKGFTLNEAEYLVGDCVSLFPENLGESMYIGRIVNAFVDASVAGDAHCIEVRWFERFTNLYPSAKGAQSERELVELEDSELNPIGCLAGKTNIVRAKSYEEAEQIGRMLEGEWFFSRGVYQHSKNEFVLYSDLSAGPELLRAAPKRSSTSTSGPEDVAESDASRPARCALKRQKVVRHATHDEDVEDVADDVDDDLLSGCGGGSSGRKQQQHKGPGKQCVECGATQTPQWREGPAGPKTLCNACGVRFNRLRSSGKRSGSGGGVSTGQRQQGARPKAPRHSAAREAASARRTSSPGPFYSATLVEPSAAAATPATAAAATTGGRPMRHAALMAANRTAAFARTGAFPDEEPCHHRIVGNNHQQHSAAASGQDEDSSHHSSESAEDDLVYTSTRDGDRSSMPAALLSAGSSIEEMALLCGGGGVQQQRHHMGSGDLSGDVASAAASLGRGGALTPISCDMTATGLVYGGGNHHSTSNLCQAMQESSQAILLDGSIAGPSKPAPSAAGNMLRSVALRAVSYCPDVSEFGEVFASFEQLRSRLPDDVVEQLLGVTEQVNVAANEAVDADNALQAVVQMMSLRQKAADAARERAATAVDKLKGCMVDLLHLHGGSEEAAAAAAAAAATGAAPGAGLLEAPSDLDLGGGLGGQASVGLLLSGGLMGSCAGDLVASNKGLLGMGSCWGSGMDSMEMAHLGLFDGAMDPLLMGGGFGSMDSSGSLLHHLHGGFGSAELIECHN